MRMLTATLLVFLIMGTLLSAADQPDQAAEAKAAQEAAKKKAKLTITDPAKADEDYAVQGEYVGFIAWPQAGNRRVGLQVVALGGGKFDGALFSGGLPGDGWNHARRELLDGGRKSYGVQLVGWLGSVLIQGNLVQFYDAQGRPAGTLQKVQRVSATMGSIAPPGAVVLFDERTKKLDQFSGAKLTPEGYLHSGLLTKMSVGDFRMHLEFRTPYMPYARGQARANSGVYIQQRYELQILDSFGLAGEANECGGLYRQTRPDLNMCFPPLVWQTYDIYFRAARFSAEGKKTAPARITAYHNGVAVHYNRDLANKTGGGKAEGPEEFPINLQDHGNPVAFRNVWILPNVSQPASPVRVSSDVGYKGEHERR